MKVCYFIQTHKCPEQIYRLVRTIKKSSPNSIILLNHNFRSSPLDLSPIEDLSNFHLLTNQEPLVRANFSCQIQPYLNAINWLFEKNCEFDWLINLTGQDYPTQPISEIEDFLAKTDSDGFIRYWDVFEKDIPWDKEKGFKRYYCQYWRVPGRKAYSFLKTLQKLKIIKKYTPLQFYLTYGPLLGLPSRSVPFNKEFICYGGWAWYTLSRNCVEYIREFVKNHPKIVDYYKKTVVPEESFVQTILVNSKKFKLVNDDRRYIDYSSAFRGSPRTLTIEDYETITNGKYHFARKFDLEVDRKILDKLDDALLLKSDA